MTEGAKSYREDPSVPDFPDDRPLVIFDGMCVLCSGGALWLMRFDRKARFRLTAAQSQTGAALFRHYGLVSDDYETMILLEDGKLWQKSDAWLRICRILGFPYALLWGFHVLPRRLRDAVYETIARNRFRWFGRRDTCFLPEPGQTERFVS